MTKPFTGKTIFITGAAKGQGRAAAIGFAKQGANIVAFDLASPLSYPAYNKTKSADLDLLVKEITAIGGKIITYAGDIRQEKDVKESVQQAIDTFGAIDILFNNAGICAYGLSHELSEQEWLDMININLNGAWLVSKFIIPHMIQQKRGVIIYNSSIGGLRGMNRLSHYSASKYALVGLTKSQAIELAPYNIRVISIHPTGVNTPLNDGLAELEGTTAKEIAERSAGNLLPVPWIEPEDVVDSLLFLSSDKAKYITGSQYVLDAGLLTR